MTILARGPGPAAACAEVPALLLLLVLVVVPTRSKRPVLKGLLATPGVLRGTTIVPWGYYGDRHYEHYTMHYKAGYG